MAEAVIIDAVRTPVAKGKPSGAYADMHPVDLHAHVLRALVQRTGVDPADVDDVISGAVGQIGEQSGNTARWATLAAGFPASVPAGTVGRPWGYGPAPTTSRSPRASSRCRTSRSAPRPTGVTSSAPTCRSGMTTASSRRG